MKVKFRQQFSMLAALLVTALFAAPTPAPAQVLIPLSDSPSGVEFSDTLAELSWLQFLIGPTETVTDSVTIKADWVTDDFPEDGSLVLFAPNGERYTLISPRNGGAVDQTIPITPQLLAGTWGLSVLDSYGDGGCQVKNLSLIFSTVDIPLRQVYEVNAQNDVVAEDGLISIREAIIAANTLQPVNEAPAGGLENVILLPPGTITMEVAGTSEDLAATGDLDITGRVTLLGSTQGGTTIDGAKLDRILEVHEGSVLFVDGVTFINGLLSNAGLIKGSNDQKIVGGVEATPQEFPWLGHIQYYFGDVIRQKCGATLIAPRVAMTAAHCFDVADPLALRHEIIFNTHSISSPAENSERANIVSVLHHPDWDPATYNNDLALLLLDREVPVTPIALVPSLDPAGLTAPGSMVAVAGWGALASGGQYPDLLQKLQMIPINTDAFTTSAYGSRYNPETMLPAGGEAGKDACQGDSGGPLFANTGTTEEPNYVQVGIVSWGDSCALPNTPGLYTRLPNYIDWLQAAMASLLTYEQRGGAIANAGRATLVNSVLRHNEGSLGGAIFNSGALNLHNVTVSNNAGSQGSAVYSDGSLLLANSILWGNRVDANQIAGLTGLEGITAYASNVQNVLLPGETNLSVSPKFVNAFDLRLKPESVMINAGINEYVGPDPQDRDNDGFVSRAPYDATGVARIQGFRVDIGAYETDTPGEATPTPFVTPTTTATATSTPTITPTPTVSPTPSPTAVPTPTPAPIECGIAVGGVLEESDADFYDDGTRVDFREIDLTAASGNVRLTMSVTGEFNKYIAFLDESYTRIYALESLEETATLTGVVPPGRYVLVVNNYPIGDSLPLAYTLAVECERFAAYPTLECDTPVSGTLEESDDDWFNDGTRSDSFVFTLDAPASVEFTAEGNFNKYLALRSKAQTLIADTEGTTTLSIVRLLDAGRYEVMINNFSVIELPVDYSLNALCRPDATPTPTSTPAPTPDPGELTPIACGEMIGAELTESDPDRFEDGTRADDYLLTIDEAVQVQVTVAGGFDPFVQVRDLNTDEVIVSSEEGENFLSAWLEPGQYLLIANNYSVEPLPLAYELSVTCLAVTPTPTTTPTPSPTPVPPLTCGSTGTGMLDLGDFEVDGQHVEDLPFDASTESRYTVTVSGGFSKRLEVADTDFQTVHNFPATDGDLVAEFEMPEDGNFFLSVWSTNAEQLPASYTIRVECAPIMGTVTPTATPVITPTITATATPSPSPSPSPTATATAAPTPTPTATPVTNDTDRDGLTDVQEATLGTDPTKKDTDGDRIEDGVEVALGTDPLDANDPADRTDADRDGIPDSVDNDPASRDSDGDGYADGYELARGSDPSDPTSKPSLGDTNGDNRAEFTDAVIIFNVFLGNLPANNFAPTEEMDLNRDGFVDSVDGVILFNWFLGNIPIIPLG